MRLLNVRTYQVEDHLGKTKPEYAILSHTWEEEEVSIKDVNSSSWSYWGAKKGFLKVKQACRQALSDGYSYIWIDTCCIDKESSAELSEAINSMFRWYKEAAICYAYLSDVASDNPNSIINCRWLTRGWTLQEMIAPDHVHFFSKEWKFLGSRTSLASYITKAVGIDKQIFTRGHSDKKENHIPKTKPIHAKYICKYCGTTVKEDISAILGRVSVGQRMKWASKRTTTRDEDMAYCLMGLFDVNIPLLYGEGEKAFLRLQQAILNSSNDHSILAFRPSFDFESRKRESAILAYHPRYFCDNIQNEWLPDGGHSAMTLSKNELTIEMYICPVRSNTSDSNLMRYIGILDCTLENDYLSRLAILLTPIDVSARKFRRLRGLLHLAYDESPQCRFLVFGEQRDPKSASFPERSNHRSASTMTYDEKKVERLAITIVSEDGPDYYTHRSLGLPLRLAPLTVRSRNFYSLGPTSPAAVAGYIPRIMNGRIAIVSFYANSTFPHLDHFLVAWGHNQSSLGRRGAWCRIWTPSQIIRESILELKNTTRGRELVEEIVNSVRNGDVGDHMLKPRHENGCGRDERVLNCSLEGYRVKVTVDIQEIEFIGRNVLEMNVNADLIESAS